MGVSSMRGVTDRILRSTALMKPVCSATPRPSIATSTTPNGGKLTKVFTSPAMKPVSDVPATWLTIWMGWPERGSMALNDTPDNHHDTSHTTTIRIRNSAAGSGNRLPVRSIRSSRRVVRERGVASWVAGVIVGSGPADRVRRMLPVTLSALPQRGPAWRAGRGSAPTPPPSLSGRVRWTYGRRTAPGRTSVQAPASGTPRRWSRRCRA